MRRRVYGPELMQTFCGDVGSRYRHFLYGGKPDVTPLLARTLREEYGIDIVDYCSPPFRELSEAEDREIVSRINSSGSDVLWVGLSTPKQERWMHSHRDRLEVPVVVGVGAAFDIISGVSRQAPSWMRENGLEWAFRLLLEPRRLWRRYLVYGPEFALRVGLELFTESERPTK
jgi:N-acetylglucosaminyldiphosphoundecaprenol N-acetyl-beta-D-mannosaminyltransferase